MLFSILGDILKDLVNSSKEMKKFVYAFILLSLWPTLVSVSNYLYSYLPLSSSKSKMLQSPKVSQEHTYFESVCILNKCKKERKWSHSVMSDSLRPHGRSLPGSSIHGIFQARVLEWVAIALSRGSSWSRDWTQVSHIVGRHFTIWATGEIIY